MFEGIIRLACLVFGGILIFVTVLLCLYLVSNQIDGDDTPIVEIFIGGVMLGSGFIVFGIQGENAD